MNTRLSKVSATALLVVVLSLGVSPSSFAASRDAGDFGDFGVRDRIVRFIHDIQHFFRPSTSSSDLSVPKP